MFFLLTGSGFGDAIREHRIKQIALGRWFIINIMGSIINISRAMALAAIAVTTTFNLHSEVKIPDEYKQGGFAIGSERLLMRLVGADNIRETTLFPRDVNRLTP